MSESRIFVVDSFTDQPFKGNPAGVHVSTETLTDSYMQSLATELGFSETAFITPQNTENSIPIRYFSPIMEIPLCGHATLAASKIVFEQSDAQNLTFETKEHLKLKVTKSGERIEMDFPVYGLETADAPPKLLEAIGIEQVEYAGFNRETEILMLEIDSFQLLAGLTPNFPALIESHDSISGLLITAKGDGEFDFHSRFFWPWSGGEEDPVTGATHTFMAKYWSDKLGKKILKSFQASKRTGAMEVEIVDDSSLKIRGHATVILEGKMRISL